MEPIVRVDHLSFRYLDSERPALSDVSLEIAEGEIVVLAGQSGCGKSTLLRCVNGLIPHMYPGEYHGSVTVAGLPVESSPMRTLAQKVGLLFQNPENQIFMFSVERDIAFGLENLGLPRGEIRRRVDEVMETLGITPLAQRAPHELSDGQKQRVALAGVLAMRPGVVILDEPTSLLDPQTATELVSLLQRLNKESRLTFVVVEHRLELMASVADRIIVMDRGSKLMDGVPSAVLTDARSAGLGISIPPVSRLYSELASRGLKLPRHPSSPEEMAEEVDAL